MSSHVEKVYTGSHLYHAGDISAAELLVLDIGSENGDELLVPDKKDDDPIALEDPI